MNTFTLYLPFCGPTLQQPPHTVAGLNCPTGPVQQQPHTIAGLNCPTGPVQQQPHTIMGFNCPTGLPQTVSDPNCGMGAARIPFSQICGTTPVGAVALPPTFFGTCTIPPHTMGCAYGGAQGHLPPHTMITVAVPPHAQEAQTWVRPHTLDVYCGTSPVAQGAAAPQQTYVLPTLGHYPTIPPVTVCCYR